MGWCVLCYNEEGQDLGRDKTGAATALGSVGDQRERAKAELGDGDQLFAAGVRTERGRVTTDLGATGVLPRRSSCNDPAAAPAFGCHGEGKLKANFLGTQAFPWLPLQGGESPQGLREAGTGLPGGAAADLQVELPKAGSALGQGGGPFPGLAGGRGRAGAGRSPCRMLCLCLLVSHVHGEPLVLISSRGVWARGGGGQGGLSLVSAVSHPPCPRCTAV